MLTIYLSEHKANQEKGRLWRVISPNGKINYVLGSMHISNEVVLLGTPELNYIFNTSKYFLFELPDYTREFADTFSELKSILNMQVTSKILIQQQKILASKPDLYKNLCNQVYTIINLIYINAGESNPYSTEDLKNINYVVLLNIASRWSLYNFVTSKGSHSLDEQLFIDAKAIVANKTCGLTQTVETETDIINSELNTLYAADEQDYTKYFLDNFDEDINDDTYYGYFKIILSTMAEIARIQLLPLVYILLMSQGQKLENVHAATLENKMLFDRTSAMVNKVLPHFKQGEALFVTGFAHCLGENGVLSLLQNSGYTIECVHETPNLKPYNWDSNLKTKAFYFIMLANFLSMFNSDNYKPIPLIPLAWPFVSFAAITALSYQNIAYSSLPKSLSLLYISSILGSAIYALYHIATTPSWERSIALSVLMLNFAHNKIYRTTALHNSAPQNLQDEWEERVETLYEDLELADPELNVDENSIQPVIHRNLVTKFMDDRKTMQAEFKFLEVEPESVIQQQASLRKRLLGC